MSGGASRPRDLRIRTRSDSDQAFLAALSFGIPVGGERFRVPARSQERLQQDLRAIIEDVERIGRDTFPKGISLEVEMAATI